MFSIVQCSNNLIRVDMQNKYTTITQLFTTCKTIFYYKLYYVCSPYISLYYINEIQLIDFVLSRVSQLIIELLKCIMFHPIKILNGSGYILWILRSTKSIKITLTKRDPNWSRTIHEIVTYTVHVHRYIHINKHY